MSDTEISPFATFTQEALQYAPVADQVQQLINALQAIQTKINANGSTMKSFAEQHAKLASYLFNGTTGATFSVAGATIPIPRDEVEQKVRQRCDNLTAALMKCLEKNDAYREIVDTLSLIYAQEIKVRLDQIDASQAS